MRDTLRLLRASFPEASKVVWRKASPRQKEFSMLADILRDLYEEKKKAAA